jgi:hypothetical protein
MLAVWLALAGLRLAAVLGLPVASSEERHAVAAHEAGHVLAAVGVGAVLVRVCAASPVQAETVCEWPGWEPCLDRAAFAVAGLVAEVLLGLPARYDPAWPPGADADGLEEELAHGVTRVAAVARAVVLLERGRRWRPWPGR